MPRRAGAVEVFDLSEDERSTLWREVDAAAIALRRETGCRKINIGALGNIVSQLHVHVVARFEGDAAWPGPVWGKGVAEPYRDEDLRARLAGYKALFRDPHDS
jgi:diadenosine tetraphosphate (Ap4A) HIT family hydrolase